MKVIDECADCLYRKQAALTDRADYLSRIRKVIRERKEDDSAPYLAYLFDKVYEEYFGSKASLGPMKKKYNALALSMENALEAEIGKAEDPAALALLYARIGNYIDFAALKDVNEETFLGLFRESRWSESDRKTFESLMDQCSRGRKFLLVADNCGEIELDKLFLRQLKRKFPQLEITVMVRGGEVYNDATREDAYEVGIDEVAKVVDNGMPLAGTVYRFLPDDAKAALDGADVILAKGQANYETLSQEGRHVFYSLLCKCERFINRFGVEPLTGILIEENGENGHAGS